MSPDVLPLAHLSQQYRALQVDDDDESQDEDLSWQLLNAFTIINSGMSDTELDNAFPIYKAWVTKERRILPGPAPYDPPGVLVLNQHRLRQEHEGPTPEGSKTRLLTFSGFPKHHSKAPFEQLERISFDEMLIRKVHYGRYLLCRSITPCVRLAAINFVAQDPDGRAHDVAIYNFPTTSGTSLNYVDQLFPVGTIMAIREPFLKAEGDLDPYSNVCVDSPTDVIFIGAGDPILQNISWKRSASLKPVPLISYSPEQWKDTGNALFKDSRWLAAAMAYSHGLQLDPNASVLYLNRAEAFLRLGFYSGALADANRVLSTSGVTDALREKATFRAAKADYARGNYVRAEKLFGEYQRTHPGDKESADWIARARKREIERKTGHYDWTTLLTQAKGNRHLDIADYQGPIKVQQMPGRGGGRGIVATEDISIGHLLVVSKPFVCVYGSELPPSDMVVCLNSITESRDPYTQSAACASAIQKLYGNPDLYDHVADLWAGSQHPRPPPTYPPATASDPAPVNPLAPTVNIDVARLECILMYNGFSPPPVRPSDFENECHERDHPSALYLLPSMFNHSCVSNANWFCIGDVMFIRAARHIAAGEEITIPYLRNESYDRRHARLRYFLGGACGCELCRADRADGEDARKKRDQLASSFERDKLRTTPVTKLRMLEKRMEATYSPSRGTLRPLLGWTLGCMAHRLRMQGVGSLGEAIEYAKRGLECEGFVLAQSDASSKRSKSSKTALPIETTVIPSTARYQSSVLDMLKIARDYKMLKDRENASRWVSAAYWLTTTSVGGDKRFFMQMVGGELNDYGLMPWAKGALAL